VYNSTLYCIIVYVNFFVISWHPLVILWPKKLDLIEKSFDANFNDLLKFEILTLSVLLKFPTLTTFEKIPTLTNFLILATGCEKTNKS